VIPGSPCRRRNNFINGTRFISRVETWLRRWATRVDDALGSRAIRSRGHGARTAFAPLFGRGGGSQLRRGAERAQMRWMLGYTGTIVGLGSGIAIPKHIQESISLWRDDGTERSHVCVVVKSGWTGRDDLFQARIKDSFSWAYTRSRSFGCSRKWLALRKFARTTSRNGGRSQSSRHRCPELLRKQRPFEAG